MRLPNLVLLLAALLPCLAAPSAHAITGGTPAGPDLTAHAVMIVSDRGSFCSAAVLGPRLLLTAAHCVRPGAHYRLLTYGASGTPDLAPLGRVLLHPRYDPRAYARRTLTIDLALVGLAAPLPASYVPLAPPAAPGPGVAGAPYRIAGFGLSDPADPHTGGTLREATLAGAPPVSSVQLRLADPSQAGRGSCSGDSGGPVLDGAGTLIGVLASAVGPDGTQGCGGMTGVALLATALPWLREGAARLGSPLP